MYCEKCHSEINDGSIFCPECGEKVNNNYGNNYENNYEDNFHNQMPYNYNPNSNQLNRNSLVKCAWFAPVAIILDFILSSVTFSLFSVIGNSDISSGLYYWSLAIRDIIYFIVGLIPYFATFAIAAYIYKIDKYKIKIVIPIIFFAQFLNSIPGVISSIIIDIGSAIDNYYGGSTVSIISVVISIIFTVALAVGSYFIVAEYFKYVERSMSENTDIK